ncbi:MAG: hypothetical protein J6B21_04685 [Oscillospiraceae bacterium]|nr:hypothetical protein [Oscillospiraceae bacterium]
MDPANTETYAIEVEFAERTASAKDSLGSIAWNQYYDKASGRMDEIKTSAYEALIGTAPMGVDETGYEVQIWTDGLNYNGAGIKSGWVPLTSGTYDTVALIPVSNEYVVDAIFNDNEPVKVRIIFKSNNRYPEVIAGGSDYSVNVGDSRPAAASVGSYSGSAVTYDAAVDATDDITTTEYIKNLVLAKKGDITAVVTDENGNTYNVAKYSLQGTTQGRYLTGGVPPVRFSM